MTYLKAAGITALILGVSAGSAWAGGGHGHRSHDRHHEHYHYYGRGYNRGYIYYSPRTIVKVVPVAHPTVVVEAPGRPEKIDAYEIHIPNANGSYTLVVIKKTDKGFIGPQGEFYPEHPTVKQLQEMYGKK